MQALQCVMRLRGSTKNSGQRTVRQPAKGSADYTVAASHTYNGAATAATTQERWECIEHARGMACDSDIAVVATLGRSHNTVVSQGLCAPRIAADSHGYNGDGDSRDYT